MTITLEQLTEAMNKLKTDIKGELIQMVNTSNKTLSDTLDNKLKDKFENFSKSDDSDGGGSDDMSALSLKTKVDDLTKKLQENENKSLQDKKQIEISRIVSASGENTVAKDILARQLSTLYSDSLNFQDGKWFVKENDGVKSFNDVFDAYLESDEGKFFKPASKSRGSNSKTTVNPIVEIESTPDGKDNKISEKTASEICTVLAGI